MTTDNRYIPKRTPDIETTPFDNVEEAWMWFIVAQEARNEGARMIAGNRYQQPPV